jgi:hypothetical protein
VENIIVKQINNENAKKLEQTKDRRTRGLVSKEVSRDD